MPKDLPPQCSSSVDSGGRRSQSCGDPIVVPFFDAGSDTFSYVVRDPESAACAIIDPVLDFDYASGAVSHEGADAMIEYVRHHQLQLEWLIETHIHADHLSGAAYLKKALGGKVAVGEAVIEVQKTFAPVFNEGPGFPCDGSQFDHLLQDGEHYRIGHLSVLVMGTPGHTPACMTHVIGDCAFVGDTLFMPDEGSARADFPGGDAKQLYQSIQKILALPDSTRLFMCHDYASEGREIAHLSSVADQKAHNIHANATVSEAAFVALRQARDQSLAMPRLILPAIQVNIRGGDFPEPQDNGTVYLKVPINQFKRE